VQPKRMLLLWAYFQYVSPDQAKRSADAPPDN
jgi:hypothetical protein